MPHIAGVAVADPPHRYAQSELREAARRLFAGLDGLDRLLGIFDHAGVRTRAFVRPLDWLTGGHPFEERNRAWIEHAGALGAAAIERACARADVPTDRVGTFIFTTTTGLATPSLDALLVERAGLPRDVRRVPLFGIGCAGAVAAIALAAGLAGERPVLILSVELCSLTFLPSDRTKTNLVGAALFGDGAAAAIVAPDGAGPRIAAARTELFPDSRDAMGWDFTNAGMRLVLSPQIPALVYRHARSLVESFAGDPRAIRQWILHPGGPRVLDAFREALDLDDEQVRPARDFLRDHGNLSSASVLYILDRTRAAPGDRGLMISLGPGFAAEMVLLEWT
jgi:alkylresorcinol/alkylpyrone synthase